MYLAVSQHMWLMIAGLVASDGFLEGNVIQTGMINLYQANVINVPRPVGASYWHASTMSPYLSLIYNSQILALPLGARNLVRLSLHGNPSVQHWILSSRDNTSV